MVAKRADPLPGPVHRGQEELSMATSSSASQIRRVLPKIPEFQRGSFEALDAATACFELRSTRPDETIISLGTPGDALFFILEGEFEAQISEERTVLMQTQDLFGEIGLLLGVERTSSVVSKTEGLLLVLPGEHLPKILRIFPGLRKRMIAKAQERMPELKDALEQLD